jgi:enoyl-CoA hydratase/carnithine racemase
MSLPTLPRGAAYLTLSNPARRHALSFAVLQSLHDQLLKYNHGQVSDKALLLPELNMRAVPDWLSKAEQWHAERSKLPKVLVLRSTGPVFSSGHDLKEMQEHGKEFTAKTFELCASVMKLMQRCPIPIVAPIQGWQ